MYKETPTESTAGVYCNRVYPCLMHFISSLIQTILSVPESHRFGCQGSSRTIPSVGNMRIAQHPAPKNSCSFLRYYCMRLERGCQLFFAMFSGFLGFFLIFPGQRGGGLMYTVKLVHVALRHEKCVCPLPPESYLQYFRYGSY